MTEKTASRDSFRSKWGFILACIGSAVGMGNIWMFPTRVSKYGGGTFLLAYFIFVIVIGFTGVIEEMSFGRAARSGPVGAFGMAMKTRGREKLGKVIGVLPVLGALALAIGYSVVIGWILRYTAGAVTGSLLEQENVEAFGTFFNSVASAFGNNLWLLVGLALTFLIMIFGIKSGIEKANKIMMPLFFLLFAGLAIYMLFQPGAAEGYRYIFRIEWSGLADPMTWVYALGQSFFFSVSGRERNSNLWFLSVR